MDNPATNDLFARWRAGDDQALQVILPLIYQELRQLARKHLRNERADHTLQTTALIHEAYLRLADGAAVDVQSHCHFVALASRLMRQVLVDHARTRLAEKRQGGLRITLSETLEAHGSVDVGVLAIDEALNRLSARDHQQARVVELRFFGGLSIEETALALHISEATVKRDWSTARAWLRRELERSEAPE